MSYSTPNYNSNRPELCDIFKVFILIIRKQMTDIDNRTAIDLVFSNEQVQYNC